MREILADLVAEQQGLDQFLQKIDFRKWSNPTPAAGWSIRDHVSHLAASEEVAYNAVAEGGSDLAGLLKKYSSIDEWNEVGVERGRQMRVQQVIEWWREARAAVVDALSKMGGSERVPWLTGDMSARSFASARMAETWAHGLDLHHAVDDEPEDTLRLRHIAHLAHRMLPFAFSQAGETYEPVRIELRAPEYQKWIYGPDDADNVIRGEAGEFCRVAVRRLDPSATSLEAEGDVAASALELVRTYP